MMQVVVERKSATYSFPTPILAEAERLMGLHADGKSKWVVVTAAILALSALGVDERKILCGKVKAADGDDVALNDLIAQAQAGELLNELIAEGDARRERAAGPAGTGKASPRNTGRRTVPIIRKAAPKK